MLFIYVESVFMSGHCAVELAHLYMITILLLLLLLLFITLCRVFTIIWLKQIIFLGLQCCSHPVVKNYYIYNFISYALGYALLH
jgi:hypothetical protein